MSTSKIEMGKEYQTRGGRKVRVYCVDGGGDYPVYGAILQDGTFWRSNTWGNFGNYGLSEKHHLDLIEVKPRIRRSVWLNVYQKARNDIPHISRTSADTGAGTIRIACVRVDIDVPDGYGLDGDAPAVEVRA